MKIFSNSLIIREMLTKTTIKYYLHLLWELLFKKPENNKCWWEYKRVQLLWGTVWCSSKKKNWITIWPSNTTSWCLLKRTESRISRHVCTSMFIKALCTAAKRQKQMSINRWMNKQKCDIYTHTYNMDEPWELC